MNPELFYQQVIRNTLDKKYETIDHCSIAIRVDGILYVYVSLDNSVRANGCGFPLKNRLETLCGMINTLIEECGGSCIIFFSESCSTDLNDRKMK